MVFSAFIDFTGILYLSIGVYVKKYNYEKAADCLHSICPDGFCRW